jgi:hypothetical protein
MFDSNLIKTTSNTELEGVRSAVRHNLVGTGGWHHAARAEPCLLPLAHSTEPNPSMHHA